MCTPLYLNLNHKTKKCLNSLPLFPHPPHLIIPASRIVRYLTPSRPVLLQKSFSLLSTNPTSTCPSFTFTTPNFTSSWNRFPTSSPLHPPSLCCWRWCRTWSCRPQSWWTWPGLGGRCSADPCREACFRSFHCVCLCLKTKLVKIIRLINNWNKL